MPQSNYLISVVVLVLNVHWCIEAAPTMQTFQLCSKSLSDALYLVCNGRGYNEPFTYNEGMQSLRASTIGLVDECCYQSCSMEQLEQYCKPASSGENLNDVVWVEIFFQVKFISLQIFGRVKDQMISKFIYLFIYFNCYCIKFKNLVF